MSDIGDESPEIWLYYYCWVERELRVECLFRVSLYICEKTNEPHPFFWYVTFIFTLYYEIFHYNRNLNRIYVAKLGVCIIRQAFGGPRCTSLTESNFRGLCNQLFP